MRQVGLPAEFCRHHLLSSGRSPRTRSGLSNGPVLASRRMSAIAAVTAIGVSLPHDRRERSGGRAHPRGVPNCLLVKEHARSLGPPARPLCGNSRGIADSTEVPRPVKAFGRCSPENLAEGTNPPRFGDNLLVDPTSRANRPQDSQIIRPLTKNQVVLLQERLHLGSRVLR